VNAELLMYVKSIAYSLEEISKKLGTGSLTLVDAHVNDLDKSSLSYKSRKGLNMSGISMLSEINEDRLREERQIGELTARRICAWAEHQKQLLRQKQS